MILPSEQFTVGGNKRVRVSAANVSLSLGDGVNPSITNGSGNFVIRSGIGFFGSLERFGGAETAGVIATGARWAWSTPSRPRIRAAMCRKHFPSTARAMTLTLPAGNYIRVDGTALNLTVTAGVGTTQTLTGDFIFEQLTTTSGGETVTRIAAANVALALGDGSRDPCGSRVAVVVVHHCGGHRGHVQRQHRAIQHSRCDSRGQLRGPVQDDQCSGECPTFADGGAVVIGTTGQFVRVEGGTVTRSR